MAVIRLLNNGTWNKPPVVTAARKILIDGLSKFSTIRPLGELASFLNGTSYNRGQLTEAGTPIIRISNISDPKSEFISTLEIFDTKYYVEKGDLLVSWSASFKSIIWPGPRGVLNQHIFRITETPGNNRGYIRHAIEAVFDEMQEKVVGIGMMHLRRGDFLGHLVPAPDTKTQHQVCEFLDWVELGCKGHEPYLPPALQEQRRIVARIEELSAKIEEASGLRKIATEEAEAFPLAQLSAVFRMHSERYGTVPLEELLIEAGYGSSEKCDSERMEGGTPVLRIPNVASEKVTLNDLKYARLADRDSARLALSAGDILVVRTNGSLQLVGRSAVVPKFLEPFAFASYMIRLRVDRERIAPDYAQRMLQHLRVAGVLVDFARTTAGQYNVSLGRLRSAQIPVPPLPEQQQIVAYLDDLQAKVDTVKGLQEESEAELDALMPSILSRAFSGEL